MTSWPRRRAVRISEPRLYQASSSGQTGPKAPTARSRPLARAILPALPERRHRLVTSGTERGRFRHGTTADSVAKHWHSRNLGRLVLVAWSKRTVTLGAWAERRSVSVYRLRRCLKSRQRRRSTAAPRSHVGRSGTVPRSGRAAGTGRVRASSGGLPAQPRRQGQKRLRDTAARRQQGTDDQVQKRQTRGLRAGLHDLPTRRQRVAGKPVSWCGSMASAGVWFHTRYLGTGSPATPSSETFTNLWNRSDWKLQ